MKELLPILPKPSHYLGTEWGSIHKPPDDVDVHIALAFPDMYEVGMSYLGQKILYSVANAIDWVWAERAYAPTLEAAEIMREHGALLASMESDTPLKDLDLVSFSLTNELCYTSILFMLDLAGIPFHADKRGEEYPLIMAGGGCAFNAEPVAPFFDFMVLGDGEEVLGKILSVLRESKAEKLPKAEVLLRLKDVQGVYVPAFFDETGKPLLEGHEQVHKAVVQELDSAWIPTTPVLPFGQAVHDRLTLEIARGCTRGCRFCHAGIIYRPVRERTQDALAKALTEGISESGFGETSFLSLSTGDYSALDSLFSETFDRCAAEQVAISLPSLRVGSISERLMDLMTRLRRTGVTIAPEAGSQRLRDVINKGVDEAALLEHTYRLFERGWQQVKLYFMIGLPTETMEDIEAIFELCDKVLRNAPQGMKRLQVTAAISPFIPKPHTPFQWERQISLDEIRERVFHLRDLFKTRRKLKLRWHEPETSWLEGVISRAGRELAPAVEQAYANGAIFDSWRDHFKLSAWTDAFEQLGIDAESYLAERDVDARMSWDHLDSGVTRKFLLTERRRAFAEKITGDCRYDICRNCGVCAFDGRTSTLVGEGEELKPSVVYEVRDQVTEKRSDSDEPREVPKFADSKPPEIAEDLTVKAAHFRVFHEKTGGARFLSTLELQPTLERAMRRAGVKTSFSKGFHPLPLISFGRALPVGVSSLDEWFNVFLRENLSAGELRKRLQANLPDGLAINRVEPLSMGRKQPQAVAERYVLSCKGEESGRGEWTKAWQEFADAPEMVVERKTKKGMKDTDIRPFAASVDINETSGEIRIEFDWRERYISPLVIVRAVVPELTLMDYDVVKLEQIF